jgi:hypothetical protein
VLGAPFKPSFGLSGIVALDVPPHVCHARPKGIISFFDRFERLIWTRLAESSPRCVMGIHNSQDQSRKGRLRIAQHAILGILTRETQPRTRILFHSLTMPTSWQNANHLAAVRLYGNRP